LKLKTDKKPRANRNTRISRKKRKNNKKKTAKKKQRQKQQKKTTEKRQQKNKKTTKNIRPKNKFACTQTNKARTNRIKYVERTRLQL